MDEKDLERLMRARLEPTQDFDFREEDWEKLAHRLKRKRRWPIFWWTALLGGLLLIALSATAWHYYQEYTTTNEALVLAENTIKELNNKTSQSNTTGPKTVRKTVEVIDTVYKTVIIEKHITNRVPAQIAGIDSLIQEEWINSLNPKTLDVRQEPIPIAQESYQFDNSLLRLLPPTEYSLLLYQRDIPLWQQPDLTEAENDKPSKKEKNAINIGLRMGWAHAENPNIPIDSLIESPTFQQLNRNAWHLGVTSEMNLGKKLKLTGGVNLEKQYYHTNQTELLFGASAYDTIGFGAYGEEYLTRFRQLALRYTLGLKYQPLAERKWNPFIGVRTEIGQILSRKVDFQYLEIDGSRNEWTATINKNELPKISVENLSPLVGVDTQLSDKWKMQIEAIYYTPIKKRLDRMRRKYGFNLGFFYLLN